MSYIYVRLLDYRSHGEETIFATTNQEKAFAYVVPRTWDDTPREAGWNDRVKIYEDEKFVDEYDFEKNNMRWTSMYNPYTSPPIPVNLVIQETSCPQKTEIRSLPAEP